MQVCVYYLRGDCTNSTWKTKQQPNEKFNNGFMEQIV